MREGHPLLLEVSAMITAIVLLCLAQCATDRCPAVQWIAPEMAQARQASFRSWLITSAGRRWPAEMSGPDCFAKICRLDLDGDGDVDLRDFAVYTNERTVIGGGR